MYKVNTANSSASEQKNMQSTSSNSRVVLFAMIDKKARKVTTKKLKSDLIKKWYKEEENTKMQNLTLKEPSVKQSGSNDPIPRIQRMTSTGFQPQEVENDQVTHQSDSPTESMTSQAQASKARKEEISTKSLSKEFSEKKSEEKTLLNDLDRHNLVRKLRACLPTRTSGVEKKNQLKRKLPSAENQKLSADRPAHKKISR